MATTKPPVGYSDKSLQDKLGLTLRMKTLFIHPPSAYFSWIDTAVEFIQPFPPPWDFVHLFTNSLTELEDQLFTLRKSIKPDGMIWISWYKKSSAKSTEITEDLIRDTCLPLGLVDVKVCAVSTEWSGLKLVVRKELR
jgi:hypothetical protein